MGSNYGAAEAAYLHLSGPGVWPNETAWHPADRFITGARPEIRYRMAVDKSKKIVKVPPTYLRVRVYRVTHREKPRPQRVHLGTFDHVILEDDHEDVRTFLHELRSFLMRKMAPNPQFGVIVVIEYALPMDPRNSKNRITRMSQEWR